METEQGIVGGWGLALVLAAGLWVGCSPRTEIGEAEPVGTAGAQDTGGSVGTGGYTDNVSGSGGNVGGSGGSTAEDSHCGGRGGAGMFEPADGSCCFDRMTAGGSALPKLGANNQVFPSGRLNTDTLLNYADQVVFDPPNWELNANFPPSDRSDDESIQLPEELSQISENLGEIHITRPQCKGLTAAGRTLRVYAWWKLGGAIIRTPTEGITLGTSGGESFADSTQAALVGGSQDTRPLNTLSPIVLEHTFPESDETDAGDVVLKLWLLESFAFPSTLYINRVEWE